MKTFATACLHLITELVPAMTEQPTWELLPGEAMSYHLHARFGCRSADFDFPSG